MAELFESKETKLDFQKLLFEKKSKNDNSQFTCIN